MVRYTNVSEELLDPHFKVPSLVRVHRNLSPQYRNLGIQVWSVKDDSTGLLLFHADRLCLADMHFHISEAGRNRVRRNKVKEVHAWAVGALVPETMDATTPAIYNPFDSRAYLYNVETGKKINGSEFCLFSSDGMFVL